MPPERRSKRTASNPTTAREDAAQPYTRTSSNARIVSSSSSASVAARPANGKTTSLRLTVKAPPSKLRQATSGSTIPPNPYAADTPSESDTTPAPARRAARATRNPRAVVDPDSDELEEAELDEDDGEGDVDREISEEDAEGEDDNVDMEGRNVVAVTAPKGGALKSVEAKEMEDDDDDEELSELESGDEDELGGNGEDEEDELDDDSDDDDNSRSATPDLSKLTKRQRGGLVEFEGAESGDLMALSNEALKKKHFTEEEHVQRRAEMARRRKNLSDKRNEEEKVCFYLVAFGRFILDTDFLLQMDTINKLLHKQAPKRRTRAEMEAARAVEAGETPLAERDSNALDPTKMRWVSNKAGSILVVPEMWQTSPAGEHFGLSRRSGLLIEEVADS